MKAKDNPDRLKSNQGSQPQKTSVTVFISSPHRPNIGWQEVLAVATGFLGGLVYCGFSKQSAVKKSIVFSLSCLFCFLLGALSPDHNGSDEATVASSSSDPQPAIPTIAGPQISTSSPHLSPEPSSVPVDPPSPQDSTLTSGPDRTFLGTGPTGYSLWLGRNGCIYVKDLTQADLARLNVSIWDFKKVIKQETGSHCVFFE